MTVFSRKYLNVQITVLSILKEFSGHSCLMNWIRFFFGFIIIEKLHIKYLYHEDIMSIEKLQIHNLYQGVFWLKLSEKPFMKSYDMGITPFYRLPSNIYIHPKIFMQNQYNNYHISSKGNYTLPYYLYQWEYHDILFFGFLFCGIVNHVDATTLLEYHQLWVLFLIETFGFLGICYFYNYRI